VPGKKTPNWRLRLEYVVLVTVFAVLRWLPRPWARGLGAGIAYLLFQFHRPWRLTAEFNVRLAFPEKSDAECHRLLRRAYRQWGWQLAEFARFPRHNMVSIEKVIVYDGLENYLEAAQRGKGILYLTAHVGAWELASFAHSLHGYPVSYVNRPLDNPLTDVLVNRYRCLGGNQSIDRRNAARAIFEILRQGGTVGVLMDQNTLLDDGSVFVDFFSVPASTTAGLARIALRTEAAVVPGFVLWDEERGCYRLRFDPALPLVRTGDTERDVVENTARFTKVIEDYVRRYPDQWLWIHRRWKTRPSGEPPLYP
jgi:KDO2-lipid IV(A) lauroyltransferase